jgi:hypothetical protein
MFAGKCSLICLIFTVSAITSSSFGQSSQGALAGNVTDTSGAVIAGAHIVVTQLDTGFRTDTVSTSSGSYRFAELPIGRYDVVVSAPGFGSATNTGVLITIATVASLNVVLKPGSVTQSVTVDASAPTIQTESAAITGTITKQQIEDLPLSMAAGVGGLRSPETFEFLVPGTTGPGSGVPTGLNQNGVFFGKIAGGQSYGAEVLLDGASIQRSENGSSFDETSPSIEALQELSVTTSTPPAQFGRTTAGIENFSTKGGSNQFHGTAYFFFKNAAMDANNWFNNGFIDLNCGGKASLGCAYRRGQDSKYDFGGTLGGPVIIPNPLHPGKFLFNGHDRTFFFFSWEQYRFKLGGVAVSTVPTAAEKGGDFTGILGGPTALTNPCTGQPVLQNQIFDPATTTNVVNAQYPGGILCRQPFSTNNVVPSNRFSKVATAMMAGLPSPNQTPLSTSIWGFSGNYAQPYVTPNQNTTITVRIDQSIGQRSKIFGSYSSRDNYAVHGVQNLPNPFNNGAYLQDFETHYTRAGWDFTISPTILNHLNIGYNRTNSINYAPQIGSPQNLVAAGAPNFYTTSFPTVTWDGLDAFSNWGVGNNGDNIDNGLRSNEIVNWQKGRNSFTFGVDYRHQQYTTILKTIPDLSFLRSETDVADFGGTPQFQSGNSFAGFQLGDLDYASQDVYNHNSRWNSQYFAGFFEDDLKVNSALTVNLGMRYSIDFPRHEANNDTSEFSYTAPDPLANNLPGALVFGTNCHCNTAWTNTWKKDIGPRVGFAYVLPHTNEKAVIRGGGAILYGPLQYSDFGGSMTLGYSQFRSIGSIYSGPGTAAGFTPAFNLDSGYAPWTPAFFAPNTSPTQLDGGPGNPLAVGGEVITPSMGRPAMISNWSLQLQDEVAQDLIVSIGYIGSTAQNLHSGFLSNSNNINPKYFSLGDHLNDNGNRITTPGGATSANGATYNAPYPTFVGNLGQAIRPFPQYDYVAADCCLENLGHSSYDALVASIERRFRQGFNLNISYTYSKNETDADSTIPFSYDSYRSQTQNSLDHRAEKAVSIQNIPQTLSISYLYELPFGKGRPYLNHNRLLDEVIGGWEIGAIQRYETGQPLDFGCASGIPYYQNCIRYTRGPAAATGDYASSAYKKNKNGPSYFNQQSWFKPAYRPAGWNGATDAGVPMSGAGFVDENREGVSSTGQQWLRNISTTCADGCSYDPFVFGTGIPRVTEAITGPAWKSEDFSLLKNFSITERVKFILKGDAVDIFNRHRMGLPDTEPYDSSGNTGFGIPTTVDYGPRTLQVSGRINF